MTGHRGGRFAILFLLSLAACAAPVNSAPTVPPSPSLPPDTPTPSLATAIVSAIPISDSLLVAQRDATTSSMFLEPVDPSSGNPIQDSAPIDLGIDFAYGFAPDGRTLIFTKYASRTPSRGELHFVDLGAWRDDFAILLLSARRTSALAVSRDGKLVAVATVETAGGSLWLVDAVQRVVLAHVHTDDLVEDLGFTPDGQGLMSYERPATGSGGLDQAPPTAALRSTSDLTIEWSRPLTAAREGLVSNASSSGNPNQPGSGSEIQPAVVFSPVSDVLYVLHADVSTLTRVDFDRKSTLTLDIRPQSSSVEHLPTVAATPAQATTRVGIQLQARISSDGAVAYTDGFQTTATRQADGNWVEVQSPLPVQAIRLKDATQIFKSAVTGATLDLAASGATLLIPQLDSQSGVVSATIEIDTSDGSETGEYQHLSLQFNHTPGGEPILVSAISNSPNAPSTQMTTISPDHRVLASWTLPTYAKWLILP